MFVVLVSFRYIDCGKKNPNYQIVRNSLNYLPHYSIMLMLMIPLPLNIADTMAQNAQIKVL